MRPPTNGDIAVIRLANTIIEGRIGTIQRVVPKRQRWPELFVIYLDQRTYDADEVVELHLSADEFYVVG